MIIGIITLFYHTLASGVQQKLADLQRQNIVEVISSLHVLLHDEQAPQTCRPYRLDCLYRYYLVSFVDISGLMGDTLVYAIYQ